MGGIQLGCTGSSEGVVPPLLVGVEPESAVIEDGLTPRWGRPPPVSARPSRTWGACDSACSEYLLTY